MRKALLYVTISFHKEELELFRNGKMSGLRKINCARHLKSCSECAGFLDELADDDRFISDLRSSVQMFQELSDADTASSSTAK